MPKMSLRDFIKREAPREWTVWRAMSDICAGRKEISTHREMLIDRAVGPLFEKCRQELLKKHKIDPITLVSAVPPDAGSFSRILASCPTRPEREAQITSLAKGEALQVVLNCLISRYRKRCAVLAPRISKKTLAALKQPDVEVTASLDGVARRPLARAEIEKAHIDLDAETLVVEDKIWWTYPVSVDS